MPLLPQTGTGPLAELEAWVEYLRDLGVYDLYRLGAPGERAMLAASALRVRAQAAGTGTGGAAGKAAAGLEAAGQVAAMLEVAAPQGIGPRAVAAGRGAAETMARALEPAAGAAGGVPPAPANVAEAAPEPAFAGFDIPVPVSLNDVLPLPAVRVAGQDRGGALVALRAEIGDCTRCPLAYAGRRNIVFGNGAPVARLMFVGEGPGADEDEQGQPFVGKSGQLLNNMIGAMGLKREEVYVANIVKCRPPANRAPEPVEANRCRGFLARQMDIVQPEYVVALGLTAAMYVLGVKQSLASLRGQWHEVRGAKVAVTYHPAYLLRDPRQKGEAWKDLQRVMAAMGLKGAAPKG